MVSVPSEMAVVLMRRKVSVPWVHQNTWALGGLIAVARGRRWVKSGSNSSSRSTERLLSREVMGAGTIFPTCVLGKFMHICTCEGPGKGFALLTMAKEVRLAASTLRAKCVLIMVGREKDFGWIL